MPERYYHLFMLVLLAAMVHMAFVVIAVYCVVAREILPPLVAGLVGFLYMMFFRRLTMAVLDDILEAGRDHVA